MGNFFENAWFYAWASKLRLKKQTNFGIKFTHDRLNEKFKQKCTYNQYFLMLVISREKICICTRMHYNQTEHVNLKVTESRLGYMIIFIKSYKIKLFYLFSN